MKRARVIETDNGIQDGITVAHYDRMMCKLRDRGWMETNSLLASGICSGRVLEIGPGPGYLGLEWLTKTQDSRLTAVEISVEMIEQARRNAAGYGLQERVEYVPGDAHALPFEDAVFDGVFSNGSLHEWAHPKTVFAQIHRVLKPGARFFVSDLRRDMSPLIAWFLWLNTRPREIRPGLLSSIRAAYTADEVRGLADQVAFRDLCVKGKAIGIEITGVRAA